MNWYIEKTTHNERTVIINSMYGLFADLEQAETLLDTVIEDCFNDQAGWAGSMLRIVQSILTDTIVAYYLTVADTENVKVKNYIAAVDAVKTAIQCENAFDDVLTLERNLTAERRTPIMATRIKIGDMKDAEAIPALENLARNES